MKKSGSSLVTVRMRKKLNTKRPVEKKHDIGLGQGWYVTVGLGREKGDRIIQRRNRQDSRLSRKGMEMHPL